MKMAFVVRNKSEIKLVIKQLSAMHKSLVSNKIEDIKEGDILVCDSFANVPDGWYVVHDVVPDKENALILDHSDTHLRLGFVTDVDEKYTELCDGKPKEKNKKEREEPLPKECPKCHYLKPPKVPTCPACGFKPEKQNDVEHVDGELQELKAKKKANKELTPEQQADFLAELRHYGMQKGYKDGWASNKYKERFGVWPNKIDKKPPQFPSPETFAWITHQNIKRAYSKKPYRKGEGFVA